MVKSSFFSLSIALSATFIFIETIIGPMNVVESRTLINKQNRADEVAQIADSLDHLNGAQFVELADPLMDGRLRWIIEQIKTTYPSKILNRLQYIPELPSRQFLQILNNLSNGEIAQLLAEEFPSLFRPRRSSLDTMSGLSLGYAKKRSLDPMSGISFGAPSKRLYGGNFDEIDRTGFSGFAKRRSNFDEMDRSGFSGFAKRRSDFDEIDHSGFSGFAKRRSDFDEIDRSGFSGFAKRRSDFDEIDRSGFSGFAKRFNFDELDRNGFTGFMAKREIDSKIKLENGVKAIPSQSKVVNNESKDKTKP